MIEFRLIIVDRLVPFRLSVSNRGVIRDILSEREKIEAQRIVVGPPGEGMTGPIDLGSF